MSSKVLPTSNKIVLRESQEDALNKFKKHYFINAEEKGILVACCGFGKTLLSFHIIKECIRNDDKIFYIIVPSIKLIEQLLDSYQSHIEEHDLIDRVTLKSVGSVTGSYIKKYKLNTQDDIIATLKGNYDKVTIIISTYKSSEKIKIKNKF
jgi:superfamily II DNA or RNA helicase